MGWLASFYFQKVLQPKIPSPIAKVVADTLVNLRSQGFLCPSLIGVEPVRVEILEFPVRSTRKEDDCAILKFYPLRFPDSEPWVTIFICLPCAEALDREGEEKAT